MAEFALRTRKILGVLRNFREHAAELGNAVPKAPTFFLKPPSSIIHEGTPIEIPKGSDVHHEIEIGLVLRIPEGTTSVRRVSTADAMKYVGGYFLALDLTARGLQSKAKAAGLPWSLAKGHDTFCPVSKFIPTENVPDVSKLQLALEVNGETRQVGDMSQLVFDVPQLISEASFQFAIQDYDLILCGTPAGVGPLKPGDIVTGRTTLDGEVLAEFKFSCIETDPDAERARLLEAA